MAKNRSAELGDVLDAVERASANELKQLREINKKLSSVSTSNLTVQRSNGAPSAPSNNQISLIVREIKKNDRRTTNGSDSGANRVQMRSYNRNKNKLSSHDAQTVAKAAEKIAQTAVKRALNPRDARGRFISANPPGPKVPRAPRAPRGGSVWSNAPSKSAQAQANAKQDANREAVEEQTKETIARQDETNDLLKDLVKETRKRNKQEKTVSGGGGDGGGFDIGFGRGRGRGKGGFFRRMGRKIFGRGGAKVAAGAAGAIAAGTLAEEALTSAPATTSSGPRRGANGRFLSKAEQEAAVLGEKGAGKLAMKGGLKAVGKIGLKAIPILGTAIGAGLDAVEGWNDTEAQKAAFGTDNVSTRQKAEYTAANVADMGGLVSGTSSLLGQGADLLGFHDAAKAMTFTTADMARGVDNIGNTVSDSWNAFKDAFTGDSKDKEKNDEERNKELLAALAKITPGNALGLQNGSPNVPTEFANDNPTQAAMRNNRNESAATSAVTDQRMMAVQGYVSKAAKMYGVSEQEINAIINAESSFNPNADSGNGHLGLMQISADVARAGGVDPANRFDPEQNIMAGAKYYAEQKKAFGGNVKSALLAYNQGAGGARSMLSGRKAMAAEGQKYINNPKFAGILNGDVYAPDSEYYKPGGKGGKGGKGGGAAVATPSGQSAPAAGGVLEFMSAAYNGADSKIAEMLAQGGVGHFGSKTSAALSVPKGLKLPAGFNTSTPRISQYHDYGSVVPQQAATAGAVTAANQSQTTPGILDILRSSAADTFNSATQGISGSGILDGLLGGMNPMVAEVMKPLTGAAGNQIDSWLSSGRNSVMDLINGKPTKQGSVTDLAASGTTATVSQDNPAMKQQDDQLSQLKLIADRLGDLLGITKNNTGNTGGAKGEPVHSAQPGPNQNIPTMSASKALLEMLEGL